MNVLIVLTVEQNVSKNRAKSGRNRNCSTMFNYQFGVGEAEGRKRRLRIPFSCKEISKNLGPLQYVTDLVMSTEMPARIQTLSLI